MQDSEETRAGLTGLCDQAIDKYFGEVTKQCTEGCGVNCVRFRQDDISPDPGLRSVRVKEMDIIDFCTLASETGMLLVLADCVKLILKTGGTAIQVSAIILELRQGHRR